MANIFSLIPNVVRVNREVTLPILAKKTGLRVISNADDETMVATDVDIGITSALLEGLPGMEGLSTLYPGSFSEELDSPMRGSSKIVAELDPCDGTGDLKRTALSKNIIPSTLLLALLKRHAIGYAFDVVGGIIYNEVHEYGIASDGQETVLFSGKDGKVKEIPFEITSPPVWGLCDEPLILTRRVNYPQLVYDGPFIKYLKKCGVNVKIINTGGAGMFALHLFRNFINPTGPGVEEFEKLPKISASFNCMPTWKTWDTDAAQIIGKALGLPQMTDLFGRKLTANACNEKLDDMWHTQGTLMARDSHLQQTLIGVASSFMERNPDCPLIDMDDKYRDAILEMEK